MNVGSVADVAEAMLARVVGGDVFVAIADEGHDVLDLRACIDAPLTVAPGDTHCVLTGIAVHGGDPGYAKVMLQRSGLGNLVEPIDSEYQGQLMFSCWNRGHEPFKLQPFECLVPNVILPVVQALFRVVENFEACARAADGFGNVGRGKVEVGTPAMAA